MTSPTRLDTPLTGPALLIWPAALALSTFLGSWAFACVFPFVALAAIAAVTMPARLAAGTVGVVWLINQVVGFTLLSYPHTAYSYSWGLAIGAATLAAMFAARAIMGSERRLVSPRLPAAFLAAFLAAFATYELLLYAFAQFAGGLETFSAAIVGDIFRNDAIWFVGLAALRLVLTRAAPRWFGNAHALRAA